jgi:hypothetical protein
MTDMTTAPTEVVGYGPPVDNTRIENVSQTMTTPLDRVRWGPIWAGLLTTLTVLLLLSLLGLGIGLSTINGGGSGLPSDAGRNSGIWEGISGIISFLLGGFVAGRAAAIRSRGWGSFNGAMVFFLGVPIILLLASQGLGAILGTLGSFAARLPITSGQLHGAANGAGNVVNSISPATAWGALIGLLIALLASAIGGALGARGSRPAPNPPTAPVR